MFYLHTKYRNQISLRIQHVSYIWAFAIIGCFRSWISYTNRFSCMQFFCHWATEFLLVAPKTQLSEFHSFIFC